MKTPMTLDQWESSITAKYPGASFRWGEYQQGVRYAFINGCDVAWFDAFEARPTGSDYGEFPAGLKTHGVV